MNKTIPAKMLEQQLQAFSEACRAVGLKLTHQRLEIFRELARAGDHPAAEVLHRRLLTRLPTLSLDTVYRTLATFEQHRLIAKVATLGSQARFEADMAPHHHAICRICGDITDFIWPSMDEAQLPEAVEDWGRVERKNLTLHGFCRKCTQASSDK